MRANVEHGKPIERGWWLPCGLLLLAVIAVPLRILEAEGLPRYRSLHRELLRLKHANLGLAVEVERLRQEVSALRSDPAAVERIARDELGMVREGEVIFQFVD
mgnify:CR=1 FL=1